MPMLSRRSLVCWPATCCAAFFTSNVTIGPDAPLKQLGPQFDYVSSKIDFAIKGQIELSLSTLQHMEQLVQAIDEQPATVLEGFRVKARVAAWALLGDLDALQDCELANQMARSICRDLIRNFDPGCEKPGAVARLIETAIS